jgi:hypothetical protein
MFFIYFICKYSLHIIFNQTYFLKSPLKLFLFGHLDRKKGKYLIRAWHAPDEIGGSPSLGLVILISLALCFIMSRLGDG